MRTAGPRTGSGCCPAAPASAPSLLATGRRSEPVARGPRGALGWAPSPRLAVPTVPSPADSLEAPHGCQNVTGAVSAALKAGPAWSRRRSPSGFPPGSSESGRHLLHAVASFSYRYFVSGSNP